MSNTAATVVRDYYEALRQGDPLSPFFDDRESTVKFGISEALYGYDDVAAALNKQTETTADWAVESHHLAVDERGEYATVADEVTMAWTDTESGERKRFETRWSGTLRRRASAEPSDSDSTDSDRPPWMFATMHVSAPQDL